MNYLIILSLILVNAVASVLVKVGSSRDYYSFLGLNKYYLLGLFFYGISFILFAWALKRLPINLVHPVATSGTILFVALLAYFVLDETFNIQKILGIILTLIGITLITWK